MSTECVEVSLCEQDLAEFLDDNAQWVEAYRAELERRLKKCFDEVTVEIDYNSLEGKVYVNGEDDDGTVYHITNQMVNDWDWLPA